MRILHYNCLIIGLIGALWGVTSSAYADQAQRHYAPKSYIEQGNKHHRYYDKAPRTIHRPLSSHRKHKHHWRQIPRHYRGNTRGDTRHHPHIRRNRHGVHFSGYGFIPYGHHHHHRCPHWHYESFVLGLGLDLLLNH